jgi:Protein kinase domain
MPAPRRAIAVVGFASSVAAAATVVPISQPLTTDPLLLLLLWAMTASVVAPVARGAAGGRILSALTAGVITVSVCAAAIAALGGARLEQPSILRALLGISLASLGPASVRWLASRIGRASEPQRAVVGRQRPQWGDPAYRPPSPLPPEQTRRLPQDLAAPPRILNGRWLVQPVPLPGADPGGFSVLRPAADLHQGRSVVVKLASRPFAGPDDHVARLMREGALVSELHSPYVISLLDRGWDAGVFFLVLEYHPIGSLAGWLDRRYMLEMATVTDLVCEILRALSYLHGLDEPVIHRDVTPRNLLVRDEQPALQLLLTDFGSARRQSAHGHSADAGITIGSVFSPYYAPPELVGGSHDSRWGPQSDIYSACAIFYELLTGQPPYRREARRRGAEFHQLVLDPLTFPVPASHINRGLPPVLDDVLAAGLAHDPGCRFIGAQDLLPLLEEIGRRHGSQRIAFADLRARH